MKTLARQSDQANSNASLFSNSKRRLSNSSLLSSSRNLVDFNFPPLVQTKLTINQPGDRFEQEADRVADAVMRMPDPTIQLKPT